MSGRRNGGEKVLVYGGVGDGTGRGWLQCTLAWIVSRCVGCNPIPGLCHKTVCRPNPRGLLHSWLAGYSGGGGRAPPRRILLRSRRRREQMRLDERSASRGPGCFLSEHICGGARMEVKFWWARTPAWGRPYIPLRISKNTHPSGVTKSSKLYMLMNCFGIFGM